MKWVTYIFIHPNYGFYLSVNCPFDYLRQSKYVRILFLVNYVKIAMLSFCKPEPSLIASPKCLGECDVTLTQVHVFQEGRKNPPPVKLLHTFLATEKPIHKSQFMYHSYVPISLEKFLVARISNTNSHNLQCIFSCLVLETLFCRCKGFGKT